MDGNNSNNGTVVYLYSIFSDVVSEINCRGYRGSVRRSMSNGTVGSSCIDPDSFRSRQQTATETVIGWSGSADTSHRSRVDTRGQYETGGGSGHLHRSSDNSDVNVIST